MTISLSQLHLLTSTDSVPNKYYTFQTKKSGRAQVLNNPQKYSPNSPSAKIFNLKPRHERSRFEIDPRVTNSRLNLARILDHYFSHLNGFFIFFSKDWKPTTFVTMFQAVPKKKRTKENKMKKNEKEKTITRKEKKFRSVGICTTYYSSVTKRRETQRFYTSFINTGLYKYNHLSLSYISSTSTDAVPNKYISKPSIPKRTWSNFLAIFRECQHIALEKKEKSPAALN